MISLPGLHRKARIGTRIWTIVLFILAVLFLVTQAAPLSNSHDLVKNWDQVQSYLNQFGYLTPSPDGAGNLRTEDKLREAIRRMQKYGGVTPTGIVDRPTLALLKKKRCGLQDVSAGERVRRYAVQGQQWPKKDLTWSINLWPSSLSSELVRIEMTKAFKVWSDVSQLNFREVQRLDADIVVSFERGKHGDGYAFDGRGVVLAHAFFPGDGIGGDAHFDAEEPWVDRELTGIDGVRLFAVAAHEFGHSLGLSHSSVSGALMNPFYQQIDDNFQLPYDDTIGIQKLYGPRNPNRWAPLNPYIPPATRAPATTRRPYRPEGGAPTFRPRRPPPQQPERPHTCNTSFDAVTVIRRELFFFKGKHFWRLNNDGLMKGYPVEIKRFWYDSDLETVDAVYERPIDTKIVFFSGAQYWLFNGNSKEPGYPRPLTDLGLPPDLKRVDAAFVWGFNGKTYLFSGSQYWRYDESEGRVELDYPRDMGVWRGVPTKIDAAFQYTDGHTYFFKGRKFWEFNDNVMMVVPNKIRNANQYWFGCPSRTEEAPDEEGDEGREEGETDALASKSSVASNCVTLISVAVAFLLYRMMSTNSRDGM